MATVSTYLNFSRNTEEAFQFYKTVFGTAFNGAISRFGDMPAQEGAAPLSDAVKQLVMHIELPITGGHLLMGTDVPETFGFQVNFGNNMHIMLSPDSREETQRLFGLLSEAGKITMPLQDMFWGAYYGSCTDQFGIQWMFNCNQS
ncbi:MAG: VOC family protein [Terrimonas sp.]|nr:VOC family protein [Terrimonas sp.]